MDPSSSLKRKLRRSTPRLRDGFSQLVFRIHIAPSVRASVFVLILLLVTGGLYALYGSMVNATNQTITATWPATATTCSTRFSSQEVWNVITGLTPPGGGYPNVFQRVDSSKLDLWRVQGTDGYSNASTSLIEPANYTDSANNNVIQAWWFNMLDKQLSTGPTGALREVDMVSPPDALWTGSAPLGGNGTAQGTLADETYTQLANYEANLVKYFRTGILQSDAGGSVTYTATSLTDTTANFSAYGGGGYSVTATVLDSNGFPDWVIGAITSVTNSNHTLNFSAGWSTAYSGGGTLSSSTPAAGAAYNLASTTPPVTSPSNATPWPRPPSVGNVQYFELFNEPDLSNYDYPRVSPSLLPPAPVLTGVNTSGGTLTPGTTYAYRITAVNVGAAESLPGTELTITLPAGDNAVQLNWSATTNLGQSPYAYRIYGRTSGSEKAMVVVGRDAASGLTWTDKGAVAPSGALPTTDNTPAFQLWRGHEYARMWNVVAPAMKAVDPTVKVVGPTVSNPISLSTQDVITTAVTTGPSDTSWKSTADYIPALMAVASPKPDAITLHNYGWWQGSSSTDAQQWSGLGSGISDFLSQDAPVLGTTPVFVDEANIDAGGFGDPPSPDTRAETQLGAAWLADNYAQWCQKAPQASELFQEQDYNGDIAWGFISGASYAGSSTCIPQPNCANLRASQPNLEYWLMQWMNNWLPANSAVVPVTNVPAGFDAFAVQPPGSTNVTMVVINTQINTTNDVGGGTAGTTSGLGVAGAVQVQLAGVTATDAQEVMLDGTTDMLNGPNLVDLGAQNNVTLNMAGYGVALINFSTNGTPDTTPPSVPTGLQATSVTSNSVSLGWTASTDSDSAVAGYHVYRNGTLVASVTPGATTTYTDTGLSANTTYAYTVSAYDPSSNVSAQSTAINATTSTSVPGDCNGDGHVTVIDLSLLLSNYGLAYSPCDFNNDGIVNILDLSILLSNYGR